MELDSLTLNLVASAALVAVVHTALGPDHTLPFVMLARARDWSLRRTLAITALCGLGHVLSSALLGGLGIALGIASGSLETIEDARGDLAAWAMIAFGGAYALWGLRRALRRGRGLELHAHDGRVHVHSHGLARHSHAAATERPTTFWALFAVFVLGPCEPLIPLLFLPAREGRWGLAATTLLVFSAATIATMLLVVAGLHSGLEFLPLGRLDRWAHSLAGGVICLSGAAILAFGV